MTAIHACLFIGTMIISGYLYVVLGLFNKQINPEQRFTKSLDVGQMVCFCIGIQLFLVMPLPYSVAGLFNLWIGAAIGIAFGVKNNTQARSVGFFYGGLASLMGTMVGTLAVNPEVCGLPVTKLSVESPDIVIGIITLVLLIITFFFVVTSMENG